MGILPKCLTRPLVNLSIYYAVKSEKTEVVKEYVKTKKTAYMNGPNVPKEITACG